MRLKERISERASPRTRTPRQSVPIVLTGGRLPERSRPIKRHRIQWPFLEERRRHFQSLLRTQRLSGLLPPRRVHSRPSVARNGQRRQVGEGVCRLLRRWFRRRECGAEIPHCGRMQSRAEQNRIYREKKSSEVLLCWSENAKKREIRIVLIVSKGKALDWSFSCFSDTKWWLPSALRVVTHDYIPFFFPFPSIFVGRCINIIIP